MAYVRRRGNQLAIVHGAREPGSGSVQQRMLFTLYSKAEAIEVLGRGTKGAAERFRDLLQRQHPDVTFDWKKIRRAIEAQLDLLPEVYDYRSQRLRARFRDDLRAFARQLILVDPQDLVSSAEVVREHHYELEYLSELIEWRLRTRDQTENTWNADNAFYWRSALQGRQVPPDTEEHAAGLYERGDYDRAEAVFRLLVECFDAYAEGYNYLGLIAFKQRKLERAIDYFQKTIVVGRQLFPARIARSRYWRDHSTRPYMRGLRNLALTLNQAGRFAEALGICDQLEDECDDAITAAWQRATVYLNTAQWTPAAEAARRTVGLDTGGSFLFAFALFEIGEHEDALESFLHGALTYARAARMLAGEKVGRTPAVASSEEADDHNTGVSLARALHAFLARQSRPSRRFFRAIVRDARVAKLLDESVAVVRRWHAQHPTGEREAFDRMQRLRSRQFAQIEAGRLRDLLWTTRARAEATIH